MSELAAEQTFVQRLRGWFFESHVKEIEGPYEREAQHHKSPWYKVMCLTGVDYFSTLGYQPGIAFLAAQFLSPIATLILVLVTLFGALPVYRRVAAESPHGEGSITMFGELLSWWWAKLAVLTLLGFMGTDFIVTITLSAADAAVHMTENPFFPEALRHHDVGMTLLLIGALATIFLVGFKEAIGVSVLLVVIYLGLNAVVVAVGLAHLAEQPHLIANWGAALLTTHGSIPAMIAMSLLVFPKLALGLSGFETGVAVMPLVEGSPADTRTHPAGRIVNTRKLLTAAAIIMSILLIASSIVTTLLIPPEAFQSGGKANGRALAYLAHGYLGEAFGTAYDLSTILILWFAGASAMAGILNIIPRYLPRFGMSPGWVSAMRPLVLFNTAIAFVVTIYFEANVDAQAGAYATGVLFLITSAAFCVWLSARRKRQFWQAIGFMLIWLAFTYTTIDNIIERPDGLKIASFFIFVTIVGSLASRWWRSTELRVERFEIDAPAMDFINKAAGPTIRFIANQPDTRDEEEYRTEGAQKRIDHHLPPDEPVIFLEVDISDASNFADVMKIEGCEVAGHRVLRAQGPAISNSIAAFLLHVRDVTGKLPHIYFNWSEQHPAILLLNYVVLGQGHVAQMTREVLRQAEPDCTRRPVVHVGG